MQEIRSSRDIVENHGVLITAVRGLARRRFVDSGLQRSRRVCLFLVAYSKFGEARLHRKITRKKDHRILTNNAQI